jgi:hypothetical protein
MRTRAGSSVFVVFVVVAFIRTFRVLVAGPSRVCLECTAALIKPERGIEEDCAIYFHALSNKV